ncbi:hypothetical protein N656DRAFT_510208 [Canariomyces notabilis]|uniref:Uncharacterized protein n=1 Tax=Canariomyces notabilis TaxID=2074819 RepID=A0AAN6QC82_9PEZI|nr:hypothetical protein N656DRAFT_510208 [Canariomyces arenarius]
MRHILKFDQLVISSAPKPTYLMIPLLGIHPVYLVTNTPVLQLHGEISAPRLHPAAPLPLSTATPPSEADTEAPAAPSRRHSPPIAPPHVFVFLQAILTVLSTGWTSAWLKTTIAALSLWQSRCHQARF